MPHDITLIASITAAFVFAFFFGMIASRLHLPPLVGYLVAGVAVGPFTPGFVADGAMAGQLAEIGVILLMFGVGLHFSVADLMAVRKIAIPGAIGQIAIATAIGFSLSHFWGWSSGAGLVLGLSLSVASTVVLLKALEERNAVGAANGRIAIGWLVVEDLAMVLALVTLPAIAESLGGRAAAAHPTAAGGNLLVTLGLTLAKVTAFVATVMFFGPRILPWVLRSVARTGSRELFTLAVLAIAMGIAFGSAELFGVSFALGAFFAGMVLNESELSHKAATDSLPLQDAFAVLFFVSVGMLFDPSILVKQPLKVAAVVALIVMGKSLVALGIVLLLRFPLSTAILVSASLAQIGEFSFILAGLGVSHGLLPVEGVSLILAGALLSITLNPLVFLLADRLSARVAKSTGWLQRLERAGGPNLRQLERQLKTAHDAAVEAPQALNPEEIARQFPLFAGMTQEQREMLVLHFRPQDVEPGERIIRRGDKADAVYFVSSGEVEVAVGDQRIKLGPGEFFGEMALLSGAPRTADVTALDFTKLLALDEAAARDFAGKYPDLLHVVSALAEKRQQMNSEAAASAKGAAESV